MNQLLKRKMTNQNDIPNQTKDRAEDRHNKSRTEVRMDSNKS